MSGLAGIAIGSKLLGLRSAARGALDWTTENAAHLLLLALAAVFVWGWLGHHSATKWQRAEQSSEARRTADGKVWADAFAVERGSFLRVSGGLDEENRAVLGLKAQSDRRIAANHAALARAAEQARAAEALSARMKAAFASSAPQAAKDGQCNSDPTVLAAAKGGAW